jgi:thiamine biosynthesis protein ThiI
MNYSKIIVKYSEIFLKSCPVYRRFETILINNIRVGFKESSIKAKVSKERGRIYIETKQVKKASEILKRVFGIVSFSPCYHLKTTEIKKIQDFVKKNHKKWIKENEKFAVRSKRVGKHEYNSQELAKLIGDVVDRKVDLKNPDVEIFAEVRNNDCYIYTEKIDGPGGLPLGTAGKVVCLLSGGIDSAVAAWMLMKRGCKLVIIHADMRKKGKKAIKQIIKKLKMWHMGSDIKVYTYNQSEILKVFNENFYRHTCILCKRMIYRAANRLARKLKIKAILTGESLAQVASQTLDNLMVLDQASELPVFRPLIGMDKIEIINIAKKLGTYEIASEHKENCWAWPTRPKTKSRLDNILKFEKQVEKEINKSLDTLSTST